MLAPAASPAAAAGVPCLTLDDERAASAAKPERRGDSRGHILGLDPDVGVLDLARCAGAGRASACARSLIGIAKPTPSAVPEVDSGSAR